MRDEDDEDDDEDDEDEYELPHTFDLKTFSNLYLFLEEGEDLFISAEELAMYEKMEQEFLKDKEINNETISVEELAMIEKMEQEFLNQSSVHKKVIAETNKETISAEELVMIEKMEESMNSSKKNSNKRGRDGNIK